MPFLTTWQANPLYLDHAGVQIYQVFKDDDLEQGPRTYWYSLDPNGTEEGSFDVRELPGWPGDPKLSVFINPNGNLDWEAHDRELTERICQTLRAAIDQGRLRAEAAV